MTSIKNNGVIDGVMNCESTEYNGIVDSDLTECSSHALAEFVDGENRNYLILVTRSKDGN